MPEEKNPLHSPLGAAAVVLPVVAVLTQAFYLHLVNRGDLGTGLPIDDAYIFLRYAENLAAGAGFSFNPGETSFGCTSLIWPIILCQLMKWIPGASHVVISFWTGAAFFAGGTALSALAVMRTTKSRLPALFAGLVIAFTPTLLMNAVSGMETGLTLFLLALLCLLLLSHTPRGMWAGLTAGVLFLNRPEGLYFPAGVIIALLITRFVLKNRKLPPLFKINLLVSFFAVALPAILILWFESGSPLPGTYMGKIMSIDPGALDRGIPARAVSAAFSLGDGWIKLATVLRIFAIPIVIGIGAFMTSALYRVKKAESPPFMETGAIILAGYLFLPAAYGLSFPVGPAFGGYYYRYIAPILVVALVLAAIGLHGLFHFLAEKYNLPEKKQKYIAVALVFAGLAYSGWLWSFQFEDAKRVFENEVTLNTGLRMEAARWISANTPENAKIMVGYTGLGMVGRSSNRYVLDLGALINPDIFDYYRDAPKGPKKRWDRIIDYMDDRGVDYYVTFAFPEAYQGKIADPENTPGFEEAARLGEPGEPKSPYGQIRIYRIDWSERRGD